MVALLFPMLPTLGSYRLFSPPRPTARGSWLLRRLSGVSFHSISDSARVSLTVFPSKTHGARLRCLSWHSSTPFPPPLGSLRQFFSQRPTARGSYLLRRPSGVSFHSISDSARVSQTVFPSKTRGARLRRLSDHSSASISTAARVSQTFFLSKTHGARLRRLSDHSSASISITAWVSKAIFLSKTRGARFLTAPEAFRSLFSLHFRLRSGLSDSFSSQRPTARGSTRGSLLRGHLGFITESIDSKQPQFSQHPADSLRSHKW